MRSIGNFCALAAVCVVAGYGGITTEAQAGVMSIPSEEVVSGSSLVQKAHWYRHHYYRHYGYWRPYRHYRHYGYWRPYRHYGYWRPYRHCRYYGYYNPAGALAGAAVGLATAPLWAFGGWGYPYYW